jgi:hypothetical protein
VQLDLSKRDLTLFHVCLTNPMEHQLAFVGKRQDLKTPKEVSRGEE